MKIDKSIYTDFAKVFLDIVKYVLTGAILSSFIGNFDGNSLKLYIASCVVLLAAVLLYLLFHKLGRK
jgi:hypothetical protein